jgi:site-specific DNA-cytosine methylase
MRIGDFSANIGGFLLGFQQAGLEAAFAVETDNLARSVLQENLKVPTAEARKLNHNDVPRLDIVVASLANTGAQSWSPMILMEVLQLCIPIQPRAIALELPNKLTKLQRTNIIALIKASNYNSYLQELDAIRFGLPQSRKRLYIVAFRADYVPKFIYFPFPDNDQRVSLSKFLDPKPDEKLFVANDRKKKIVNAAIDACPSLWTRYGEFADFLIDAGDGNTRKLSIDEFKQIMGFPVSFKLNAGSSRWATLKLLGKATPPPVAKALAEEMITWLAR